MQFDRKKFFDGVKDRIDPTLNQEQVDGFGFLLASFENEPKWNDVRLIAYAFATIWHETAYSMQPVEEGYYLGKKAKAFQKTLRYYPFFGRGYVQLTWESNYVKAGKALGIDLKNNPGLALEPDTAFKVLTEGLFRGWFGGKITTYVNGTKTDYVNARRCVNVLDKAGLIAGYARSFEKILRSSSDTISESRSVVVSLPADQQNNKANSATDPAKNLQDAAPIPTEVEVKKETPSLFAKLGAGVTALTGIGINAGSLVQTKLEAMTPAQVLYLALALGLVGVAVYWYMRAAKAAQVRTLELVKTAADPASNTVTLTK